MPTFDVPLGRLMGVAPGLPTADMTRTVEHYQRLGFHFPLRGAEFSIARREAVELHFALTPQHDPARTAMWIQVTVEDADVLAAEFRAAGFPPRREPRDTDDPGREPHSTDDHLREPQDTDDRLREFAHVDPDGNLLLFRSRPGAALPREFDRRAFEFATAINRGDAERVRELLGEDRTLATALINSCWPLHLFADAPGHRPNAAAMVAALVGAGAELDAQAVDMWHRETALHWAASNDDVELIDALVDAGADIEHPGSSIGGGAPSQSALGYGQWAALRRLYERGAKLSLAQAAALGLLPLVSELAESDVDDLSIALWNACRAGQLETARYLSERGADASWAAPWSGETALDAARHAHRDEVVSWLVAGRP